MRDRVRFAIGETRSIAVAFQRAAIGYLSSSSVVKVHHHSLGRVHDRRVQARTDGERISSLVAGATHEFSPVRLSTSVETRRLELLTSSLQRRRSTS